MAKFLNLLTSMVVSGILIWGTGAVIEKASSFILKEALKTISKGLSSSETLANALTKGER